MKEIAQIVTRYYGLPYEDIYSKSRERRLVKCRQMAMYLVRVTTKNSFDKIGDFLNLNHATVIHGSKVIEGLLHVDKSLRKEYTEIKLKLSMANYIAPDLPELIRSKLCPQQPFTIK